MRCFFSLVKNKKSKWCSLTNLAEISAVAIMFLESLKVLISFCLCNAVFVSQLRNATLFFYIALLTCCFPILAELSFKNLIVISTYYCTLSCICLFYNSLILLFCKHLSEFQISTITILC